jgi:hypothetical protein
MVGRFVEGGGKPRIEGPGAVCPVMNRGDWGGEVFREDQRV